jgi:hypothetical protein
LQAAAPIKRNKAEPFATVSLREAAKGFAAVNCPKAMAWIWLMHQAPNKGNLTVPVPNGALAEYGIS